MFTAQPFFVDVAKKLLIMGFMDTREYREQHGLSLRAFARMAGISQTYVRCVEIGERQYGAKMARYIEEITGGAVTKEELRPDIWGDDT